MIYCVNSMDFNSIR